jgi:hypothetical protein
LGAFCSAVLQQVGTTVPPERGDSRFEVIHASRIDTSDSRKACFRLSQWTTAIRVSKAGLAGDASKVKSFYCEYARGKRIWLGRADVLGFG